MSGMKIGPGWWIEGNAQCISLDDTRRVSVAIAYKDEAMTDTVGAAIEFIASDGIVTPLLLSNEAINALLHLLIRVAA